MKKFLCNRCSKERQGLTRCSCGSYEFRIQESRRAEESRKESPRQKGRQEKGG